MQIEEGYTALTGYTQYSLYTDSKIYEVGSDRSIPDVEQITMRGDTNSQYITFQMPRYFDGVDLTTKQIIVRWYNNENVDTGGSYSDICDVRYNEESIRFAWLLDFGVTEVAGKVGFNFESIGTNELDNSYVWKTAIGKLTITDNLDNGAGGDKPDEDWFTKLMARINEVYKSAEAAEEARDDANEAARAAQEAVKDAETATEAMKSATNQANAVIDFAETAANRALQAAENANNKAVETKIATDAAKTATEAAKSATNQANAVAEAAKEATENANEAAKKLDGKADKSNAEITGSLSMGRKAGTISGANSTALGVDVVASGNASHAEGYKTVANGNYSHTENRETKAYGDQSHAEGYLTNTIGNASHAEGIGGNVLPEDITVDTSVDDILSTWETSKFNLAKGKGSHTEGKNSLALGDNSHAEGEQTVSYGTDSHAEGRSSESIGNNSHVEGYETKTIGSCSHAEGSGTTCTGNNAHAEGYYTQANENQAHAEGHSSIASGKSSHAEGQETVASGYTGHAEGYRTVASGLYSHIEGQSSTINEEVFETNNDLIIKWGNVKFSRAIGNASHVEGRNSLAIGSVSHAEGHQNLAAGPASHAEGEQTIATGYYTHAEGKVAKASGNASHAEGCETNAGGSSSHAEGYKTNANGDSSHAEGNYSTATGNWSHAQGFHASTSGLCAHAEGYYTSAISKYQHVQGKYNKYDSVNKYAHIVGNGTSTTDRNNAHTLDWTGNAWFQGSVTSNGADYAEFFEWLDGNTNHEDRVGLLVTLDGEKIKLANIGDEILGIVSGTAAVLGDNYECAWNGKFLTDDFGRILYDEVEEFVEVPKITFSEALNEETGEVEITETTEMETKSLGFFKHPRINPDYDPEQAYVNRANRPEWDTVGMVGKLYLRDDGTCEVKSYATVGVNGVATASEERTNMRVLSRVSESVVRVLLK